mgnify:CR=1 FL=1
MVGANKRHLLCMLVVCLVLLSASRCQARPSFMDSMVVGPAGLDADFFTRVGRQLQVSQRCQFLGSLTQCRGDSNCSCLGYQLMTA